MSEYLTATCAGCPTTWSAARLNMCHCSRCHESFSGPSLFDMHQVRGRCHDPRTLTIRERPLRLIDGIWTGPPREGARYGEASMA